MRTHSLKKAGSFGLILVALATVAACGPPLEARAPLSAEATAPVDERLIGGWYRYLEHNGTRLMMLLIDRGEKADKASDRPSNWLDVNFMVMAPDKAFSYHLRAHPTDLDGVTYYNVRRTPDLPSLDYTAAEEAPGFMIMRAFLVTDDLLYVCTLGWHDEGPLSYVVEKLQSFGLAARIVRGVPRIGTQIYGGEDEDQKPLGESGNDYVVLDVTSEQLADLIRNNPSDELFYGWIAFARLGSEIDENILDKLRTDPESETRQACGQH